MSSPSVNTAINAETSSATKKRTPAKRTPAKTPGKSAKKGNGKSPAKSAKQLATEAEAKAREEVKKRMSLDEFKKVRDMGNSVDSFGGLDSFQQWFDNMFRDPEKWVELGWDETQQDEGYMFLHQRVLEKMTSFYYSKRRKVVPMYLVPKEGSEDFTIYKSIKDLYPRTVKEGGEKVKKPGVLAQHSYEHQRQFNFIHTVLRQHCPEEFNKLRSGAYDGKGAPTKTSALIYANKLKTGRMREAIEKFNELLDPLIPEGENGVRLSTAQVADIWGSIKEIPAIQKMPLTKDEEETVTSWLSQGVPRKTRAKGSEESDEDADVDDEDSPMEELYDNFIAVLGLSSDDFPYSKMAEDRKIIQRVSELTIEYRDRLEEKTMLLSKVIRECAGECDKSADVLETLKAYQGSVRDTFIGMAEEIEELREDLAKDMDTVINSKVEGSGKGKRNA